MSQVEEKENSVNIMFESESEKDIKEYTNLSEENIDEIYDEIKEFIHLYLFSGEISSDFNLNIMIQDLFEMDDDDLITLKTVHFLLSDEVRDLIQILPYLLRNLSHSTQKEKEEFRGIIRGRIDWNATIKTRYSYGFNDPSLFVCSPPSKFYDLEENQLLKYLLKKIISLKKNYLDFVNYKRNDEENPFDIEKLSDEKDWYEIVGNNYKMAKKILRKVYFNDISNIKTVTAKHIRKASRNRNTLYHYVAKAFLLYQNLFIFDDRDLLKKLVENRLIRATNPHKLYEIYIFYSIVKKFDNPKLRLLYSGNNYYAKECRDDGTIVTLHYQNLPKPLHDASEYAEMLDKYDIGWSHRIPDIILEFKKEDKITYRLIEVKNTDDPEYIRKSVYKVMGYYYDFEKILDNEEATFCKDFPVVLVTYDGISIKEEKNPFNDNIIILNKKEFSSNLCKLINKNKEG